MRWLTCLSARSHRILPCPANSLLTPRRPLAGVAIGGAPPSLPRREEARHRCAAMASAVGHVTHCLFDMDGLLLDTESFYSVVQQDILRAYDREFTFELKSKMMGKKAIEAATVECPLPSWCMSLPSSILQILVDELGLRDRIQPEEFVEMREARLDQMFPVSQLMPGVERLLRHLHANGIPIAVATSSHKRHFDMKTMLHRELFSLFNHVITGDMVSNGKPDPEIFLTCMAQFPELPESPANCLVFEDAPLGVEAAVRAGMQVVMVPDENLDPSKCMLATQVLPSLEAFKPEDFQLPPFPA